MLEVIRFGFVVLVKISACAGVMYLVQIAYLSMLKAALEMPSNQGVWGAANLRSYRWGSKIMANLIFFLIVAAIWCPL